MRGRTESIDTLLIFRLGTNIDVISNKIIKGLLCSQIQNYKKAQQGITEPCKIQCMLRIASSIHAVLKPV